MSTAPPEPVGSPYTGQYVERIDPPDPNGAVLRVITYGNAAGSCTREEATMFGMSLYDAGGSQVLCGMGTVDPKPHSGTQHTPTGRSRP